MTDPRVIALLRSCVALKASWDRSVANADLRSAIHENAKLADEVLRDFEGETTAVTAREAEG